MNTSILVNVDARYKLINSLNQLLQFPVLNYTFTVGWVGGWLDKAKIKLTSGPAELKLELELSLAKVLDNILKMQEL